MRHYGIVGYITSGSTSDGSITCTCTCIQQCYGYWFHHTYILGVTCPTINPPQYGRVDVKGYTYGSRVQYICNHGYYLDGEEYRTCDYTGVWNGKPPTCKRKYPWTLFLITNVNCHMYQSSTRKSVNIWKRCYFIFNLQV